MFHSEHYDMTLYIYIIELVGEPHRRVKQALSSGILANVFQKISVVGGHCRNHLSMSTTVFSSKIMKGACNPLSGSTK